MSCKEDRRHHERAATPPRGVERRQRQPLRRMLPLEQRPAQPLPSPNDWTFQLIEDYHAVIRQTAERYGLDTYPNQLEVITAEQMMDAYASVGMPVNYRHWSY
ncbi:MAG: SpoVR family protein, partial [Stutzerimonas stutzeri]